MNFVYLTPPAPPPKKKKKKKNFFKGMKPYLRQLERPIFCLKKNFLCLPKKRFSTLEGKISYTLPKKFNTLVGKNLIFKRKNFICIRNTALLLFVLAELNKLRVKREFFVLLISLDLTFIKSFSLNVVYLVSFFDKHQLLNTHFLE